MKFDPSGGYRRLDSWVMAGIVQFANLRFCEKFITRAIDPTGRQYDQMTQAARSGKVNIVEGSARASTSKETRGNARMLECGNGEVLKFESSKVLKFLRNVGVRLGSQGRKGARQAASVRS